MKRAVADWSDELSKGANATLTSPHDYTVPFLVPSSCCIALLYWSKHRSVEVKSPCSRSDPHSHLSNSRWNEGTGQGLKPHNCLPWEF